MSKLYISGDWHLDDLIESATQDLEKIDHFIDDFDRDTEATDILGIGDLFERYKTPWDKIAPHHKERFTRLNAILARKNGYFFYVKGNHDYSVGGLAVSQLGLTRFNMGLEFNLCGWHFEHGCNLDPFNHIPPNAATYFGKGLTWMAGWIERHIYSGFDESIVSPTKYISSAKKAPDMSNPTQINHMKRAEQKKWNDCIGHTHNPYIVKGHDWQAANPGSLTKKHEYSYLVLDTRTGEMELRGHGSY